MRSFDLASVEAYGDSDFLYAVVNVTQKNGGIMDELMDSLKTVNERVCNVVMRKIENA